MLKVQNLSVAYGQHRALDNVAIEIAQGEIVTILGANGAGKTSLLKAIAGVVKTLPGKQVSLGAHDLSALPAHEIVERGLALVPEGRGIFGDLTVKENLLLGANPKRARDGEDARREKVLQLFPRLRERSAQIARTMSGGEQQMLAIGRALMSNPDILLLDEPSLGLSPIMVHELFATLRQVREAGVRPAAGRTERAGEPRHRRPRLCARKRLASSITTAAENLKTKPAILRAYLGGEPAQSPDDQRKDTPCMKSPSCSKTRTPPPPTAPPSIASTPSPAISRAALRLPKSPTPSAPRIRRPRPSRPGRPPAPTPAARSC